MTQINAGTLTDSSAALSGADSDVSGSRADAAILDGSLFAALMAGYAGLSLNGQRASAAEQSQLTGIARVSAAGLTEVGATAAAQTGTTVGAVTQAAVPGATSRGEAAQIAAFSRTVVQGLQADGPPASSLTEVGDAQQAAQRSSVTKTQPPSPGSGRSSTAAAPQGAETRGAPRAQIVRAPVAATEPEASGSPSTTVASPLNAAAANGAASSKAPSATRASVPATSAWGDAAAQTVRSGQQGNAATARVRGASEQRSTSGRTVNASPTAARESATPAVAAEASGAGAADGQDGPAASAVRAQPASPAGQSIETTRAAGEATVEPRQASVKRSQQASASEQASVEPQRATVSSQEAVASRREAVASRRDRAGSRQQSVAARQQGAAAGQRPIAARQAEGPGRTAVAQPARTSEAVQDGAVRPASAVATEAGRSGEGLRGGGDGAARRRQSSEQVQPLTSDASPTGSGDRPVTGASARDSSQAPRTASRRAADGADAVGDEGNAARAADAARMFGGREPDASQMRVESVRLPEGLADDLQAGLRGRRQRPQRVRIEVDPPELGRCELELTLRDGRVHATIVAERSETVAVMRDAEAQIREALAERDLSMSGFDVRQQAGDGGQPRRDASTPARAMTATEVDVEEHTPATTTAGRPAEGSRGQLSLRNLLGGRHVDVIA